MTGSVRALGLVLLLLQLVWFRVGGQSLRQDADALEAFLAAVLFNSNFTALQSPCDWSPAHVACQSGRISTIELSGFQLAGKIPGSTLSNLTGLTVLNLAENNLTGPLPTELSRLSNLQTLILSRNKFTGAYPDFIGTLTQLRQLNLSGNEFDGLVLEAVAKLPLTSLDLSENRFVGNISAVFQSLKNLQFVDLSRNSFEGSLPDAICDSPALTTLRLGSNGFTGPIPNSIQACRSLQSLDLASNDLDGSIPKNLDQMTALQELDLARNFLEGPIPVSIFQLAELRVLKLGTNQLDGSLSIPDGAGQQLVEINLESNRLNGTIPPALLRIPNLGTLKLGNNSFSGSLPTSILPPPGARLLQELDLHRNQLSGALPGLDTGLLKVDFSSNNFSGGLSTIPQGLQVLDMHNNRLDGGLLLSSQVDSLKYLDVSSNLFSGDFPSDFSHVVNLTRLALADNNFASYSFPDLELLGQLEVLNLSMTNLMGIIPPAIGSLRLLKLLDLSSNSLTGVIPTDMRLLNNLEILDLSDNKLQGAIPSDMINLTSLSRLDLSNNNLSGLIPTGNQWLTFPDTSFSGNEALCGTQVLDKDCFEDSRKKDTGDLDGIGASSSKKSGLVIGLVSGFAILLIVALSLFIWCRVSNAVKPILKDEITGMSVSGSMVFEKDPETWAKGIKDPHSIPLVMFEKPLLNLTFADLLQATANFKKELQIADGGYGPVYKGVLADGTLLAIKVLVEVKFTDGRDAVARIEALASNKHPNLVALVGYCLVGIDSLLLYEYMVKGDLQRRLHELPEGTRNPEDWSRDTWEHMEGDEIATDFLSWPTRHKIALGTARALAFLHHGCSPCVVHRDVKSSNILLDESFKAHLVDCGLAGIAKPTTLVMGGTVGYVPPEYGQSWQATPRGDIYSFGVVLLELVTGRKPTGHYFHDSYGGNLVGWVRLVIKDKRGQKALDPKIASHGHLNQMLEVLRIGYLCTAESPAKRPTMQQVVGLLKDCQPGP